MSTTIDEHLADAAAVLDNAARYAELSQHARTITLAAHNRTLALELTSRAWSSIFRALVMALVSITGTLDAQDRSMQRAAVQERADLLAGRIWEIETALGLWREKAGKV